MQAHKLEVLVIDFDQLGAEGMKDAICTARYRNHCISPSVEAIQTVEIGPWSDDHPLNNSRTCEAEYKRLFARTTSPVSQMTDEHINRIAGRNGLYRAMTPDDQTCKSMVKRFVGEILAAAAPHAQAPAAQQESIYTPEFEEMLAEWFNARNGQYEKVWKDRIIANIDAYTAAAVAKAYAKGRSNGARDEANQLRAEHEEAIKAKASLAQPQPVAEQGELPKWIDDQKGKDPLMDDMIHYIEQLRAAIAASQQAAEALRGQNELLRLELDDVRATLARERTAQQAAEPVAWLSAVASCVSSGHATTEAAKHLLMVIESDGLPKFPAIQQPQDDRVIDLLREARTTLEMWKDVAPAVSLCRDIDAALAKKGGAANYQDNEGEK